MKSKRTMFVSIVCVWLLVSSSFQIAHAQEELQTPHPSPIIASEAINPTTSNTLFDAKYGSFVVYKKNVRIPILWAKMPNVSKYQYKIIDISTNRVLKNVRTKKNGGFFPKNETAKDGSYKVIVYGLDKSNQPISGFSWITFFHVGQAAILPSGKATFPDMIVCAGSRDIMLGYNREGVFWDINEEILNA